MKSRLNYWAIFKSRKYLQRLLDEADSLSNAIAKVKSGYKLLPPSDVSDDYLNRIDFWDGNNELSIESVDNRLQVVLFTINDLLVGNFIKSDLWQI